MDYYDILNIPQDASPKDIRKNYLLLSKKYHPDKNKGSKKSEDLFKQISEAYTVLSDPKKRSQYDLTKSIQIYSFSFTEEDIHILYDYYSIIKESIEFKLIYKLFTSFQKNSDEKKSKNTKPLISLENIKYIDISKLYENYTINLTRTIDDIYLNKIKIIIILTKEYPIFLYICNYSDSYLIQNNGYHVNIFISPQNSVYYFRNKNICYTHKIDIYEYYFGSQFSIILPNNIRINCLANDIYKKDYSILKSFGLKNHYGKRSNLKIYYEVVFNDVDKNYKEQIKTIFHNKLYDHNIEQLSHYYKI